MGTQSGDADDASSVTSLEIPLEEPEPETPKRKIIRVAKKVQLRDFTNEEKGEEENEEEKEKEKDKDKSELKPRGWKTEAENDGTEHDRSGKAMGKGERGKERKSHRDSDKTSDRNHRHNQKAQLPTADGSRNSKLDKINAEKEIKNTNIWTQRKQEME